MTPIPDHDESPQHFYAGHDPNSPPTEKREASLVALLDDFERRLLERIKGACAEAAPVPASRIEAGLSAALAWVDENPREARASLVESTQASEAAATRRDRIVDRLAALLLANAPARSSMSPLLELILIGGAVEAVGRRIGTDREGPAVELAPDLLDLILAPYDG